MLISYRVVYAMVVVLEVEFWIGRGEGGRWDMH
jgi:hypothetical protein